MLWDNCLWMKVKSIGDFIIKIGFKFFFYLRRPIFTFINIFMNLIHQKNSEVQLRKRLSQRNLFSRQVPSNCSDGKKSLSSKTKAFSHSSSYTINKLVSPQIRKENKVDDYEFDGLRKSDRAFRPCAQELVKKRINFWSENNSARSSVRINRDEEEKGEDNNKSKEKKIQNKKICALTEEANKYKGYYEKTINKMMKVQKKMEDERKRA